MLDNNVASFYSTKPFLDMVDQSSVKSKTKIEFLDGKSVSSSAILRYVNDKTFQFHLNINKDEYRHKILEKANPSELTNIHFKFSASSPRLVQIGLLRIAYLMAFCKFGNAFILNKVYDDIRKQILNPGVDLLPSYGEVGKMKEPFEEKFI